MLGERRGISKENEREYSSNRIEKKRMMEMCDVKLDEQIFTVHVLSLAVL